MCLHEQQQLALDDGRFQGTKASQGVLVSTFSPEKHRRHLELECSLCEDVSTCLSQ